MRLRSILCRRQKKRGVDGGETISAVRLLCQARVVLLRHRTCAGLSILSTVSLDLDMLRPTSSLGFFTRASRSFRKQSRIISVGHQYSARFCQCALSGGTGLLADRREGSGPATNLRAAPRGK